MKRILLLILIACLFGSCGDDVEQMLTDYNWEIDKVVDLKTGTINQTEINNEKIWNFMGDNTYQYKTKNENEKNLIKGKWHSDGYNLLVFNEFDSTNVLIEKINTEKMVWLIKGNDSIRFYLNSKEKEIIVPDFPNMNKQ